MNILLTSAGRRTYLIEYFKKSLHGKGKVFASNSVFTYTLTQADEYVITPNIYDDSYISFLLSFCRSKSISAIISLLDIDLPILAKNKKKFEDNGVMLIVSDYEVTNICNDKWKSYQFLSNIGLKQPLTFFSLLEAKKQMEDGLMMCPVFLKPRWGMGSIGIYRIDYKDELDVIYQRIYRQIFSSYLKYESAVSPDEAILIQQGIPGQEYGIEILNDLQGDYVATFAKKKVTMRCGETDVAETVDPKCFEDIAKKISQNLRHIGMLDVDCFVSDNGDVYVLEMNCRFGGQYPFTHNAGVDVPAQIILWLKNKETDFSLLTQKNGVLSCKEINPVILEQR